MKAKISVIGLGPGGLDDMTSRAKEALRNSRVIVGYKNYIPFIEPLIGGKVEIVYNGMRQERDRILKAFEIAESGMDVSVISSGDAGIYGMAPLVYEMLRERGDDIEVEVIPGISAFQKAASLLGAPVGHDFCVISLSDLMTPWMVIEKRIKAAAEADFVTAVYNPKSHGRYWELYRLKELFLECRHPDTPVGFVRQAGREGEKATLTTLIDFDPEDVDMFTVVIIGNSQSYRFDANMVTPRGYYGAQTRSDTGVGQSIMIESFRTIERELKDPDLPIGMKWPLLHAIHTTADFEMENVIKIDEGSV
ncbi:MAG: precorrin-3B C(17)-methyltransferase, partial [Muribaculaceae bacterium]|nr:precorrin-3B C(17)-methyltransferase [Muribaculaceae bacterium]